MTEGGDDPAASRAATAGTGRVGLRAFLGLLARNSWQALLLAGILGLCIWALAQRPRPIIQYEAETEIVTITVAGELETVWNLPDKTVSLLTIANDEPVPREDRPLGVGALVLPEGARLRIIRHPDRPRTLEVEAHRQGAPPRAVSARVPDGFALPTGAIVTVPGSATEACAHRLPPLTLRGVGAITLGASLARESVEDAAALEDPDEQAFLVRTSQPLLSGGRVFVRGQPVWSGFGRTYDANELILQAGDVLRVPASAAGSGAAFILRIAGCGPLGARGSVQSDEVEVLRLGSDASAARVSFWQAVTKDPFLTLLVSLLGAFLATYWSFVNERAERE